MVRVLHMLHCGSVARSPLGGNRPDEPLQALAQQLTLELQAAHHGIRHREVCRVEVRSAVVVLVCHSAVPSLLDPSFRIWAQ